MDTDVADEPAPTDLRVVVDGAEGVAEEQLARAAVEHARRIADLDWQAERLFPDSDDHALLIRARPTGQDAAEIAAIGLALRRELSAREDVAQAAVDLPVGAYEPDDGPGAFGSRRRPPGTEDPGWVHRVLRVAEAWAWSERRQRTSRGAGIVVGHPDTGYTDHPHLGLSALDLTRDRDFVSGDDDARDPLDRGTLFNPGHGTATGSVIAGRSVGGGSPLGVAPEATVLPLRAIRGVVQVFDSDVARAVDHARRHNAHVISMSLGGKGFFGLQRAIQRAVDAGVVVCAAAGNNVRFVVAPASYANTIAVAGTDVADEPWAGSSRGSRVDVSAPAEAVHAAGFDWSAGGAAVVNRTDGTSFAVAGVAGLAALWLAHHGRGALIERYGASQLVAAFRVLLADAAVRRPPDWDDRRFGSGIIDALALLQADLPHPDEVRAAGAFALRDDAASRIAAVLGDVDRDAVVARTAALPGLHDERAALSWLARNEDELVYLLLTDADLRALFADTPGAFRAEPPAPAHATDGVRAILGTAAGTAAPPIVVRSTPLGPGLRTARPYDRADVDLSMVAGDAGRVGPDRALSLMGGLGAGWSPTGPAADAVLSGHMATAGPHRAGAFGATVSPFQELTAAMLADAPSTVDSVRVASQESAMGHHEVRHLTVRGHEVVGSDIRVTMAADDQVAVSGRMLSLTAEMDPGPPPPARLGEIEPAVNDLLALPHDAEIRASLVVFPTPDALIWAYKVSAFLSEPGVDLRIYLRADDLGLLVSHDVAMAAPTEGRANVFASNPGRDPAVTEVVLAGLHAPGEVLAGDLFEVLAHRRDRLTGHDRDFRVDPGLPGFDEPNVYHHLMVAHAWCVAALGRDPLRDNDYGPLQALVRHRLARQARGQYVPADRSFRFDDLERTAARSAEIIYHEFAHAVTDAVSRLYRSPGVAARGVAEGIADYVASSMLDDPRFGDWVMDVPDGARNCADPGLRLSGVDHADEHALGAVWAALLWDLRTALGAGLTDRLVLASLHHLVPGSSLDGAIEALVATDRQLHPDTGGAGEHEQEIRRAFDARQ